MDENSRENEIKSNKNNEKWEHPYSNQFIKKDWKGDFEIVVS